MKTKETEKDKGEEARHERKDNIMRKIVGAQKRNKQDH